MLLEPLVFKVQPALASLVLQVQLEQMAPLALRVREQQVLLALQALLVQQECKAPQGRAPQELPVLQELALQVQPELLAHKEQQVRVSMVPPEQQALAALAPRAQQVQELQVPLVCKVPLVLQVFKEPLVLALTVLLELRAQPV